MQMLTWFAKHFKTAAALAGVFSVCALPPYYFFPALFAGFTVLLLLLGRASSAKQAFTAGYWFGFGFFACGFSWIGNALLIDAATFGWLYPLALLGSGAFFGLFAAVPAWLTFYFPGFKQKYAVFPALWVLSEWIRSFILTGFPWNLLGSCLAFHSAGIQLASVFGTYGLSWLLLFVVSAPALWLQPPGQTERRASLTIMAAGIAVIYGFGFWRLAAKDDPTPSETTIRIVQPSIPQNMKWDRNTLENNLNDYISLSREPGLKKTDFVIWGETASPFPLDIDLPHRRAVTQAIPENGYLITGALRYSFDRYGEASPLNSVLIIGKNGEIAAAYDKTHLVPFGEYIPLRRFLPASFRPITNTIANFRPGNGPETVNIQNYPALGMVICYEIIFPHEISDRKNKPQWIVNTTNDGWYGNSAGPYQHLVTTRLRAVEEGITIVRAANSGISAVISRTGRVINKLNLNQRGILDTRLPKSLNLYTIYGEFGNKIPLILLTFNILLVFFLSHYKR